MKWSSGDINIYQQSKEFVDTVIIPLQPLSFGPSMRTSAGMADYSLLIAEETERQLHGRLFLMPSFTYLKLESEEALMSRLHSWVSELKEEGFRHIFFLTSDADWKKAEQELEETLLWMPVIPMETMDSSYKEEIVKEQVKQLFQIILHKWQES
ncbi:YpiF family protein [Fictibacillus sp. KIGAM418]|uniref:YpiF family protein n=1 Tax=Fictibacillus marinisediminis TaxID=2878389 RepID=A0A9X2BHD7_9BACL|nr:YpiF family protein [Fictibacillus marinisediminis]MCK6257503.1 YpiF family protein [Fictibacillus marinisediminis]